MYIDTNSLPEDITAQDCINYYKTYGMIAKNPTKVFSKYTSCIDPIQDPLETRLIEMEKQMELVKIDLKLSRLKILALEGKFTQDEITNIRKMILSQDEGSRVLADSIMENA